MMNAFIRKVYTKQYDYKKIAQETIFSDLNNVVGFLKKYVIDEELDEIYRVDTNNFDANNKDNNITNLR